MKPAGQPALNAGAETASAGSETPARLSEVTPPHVRSFSYVRGMSGRNGEDPE